MLSKSILVTLLLMVLNITVFAQPKPRSANTRLVAVGEGWAKNSVNTVIFRHNALTTFRDTQFIAYYNASEQLVLGKRKTGSLSWQLQVTPYKGDATDAHRTISMIVDGAGFLHVSWDHHNNPLNYCRGLSPGSLLLSPKMAMTGVKEQKVTYPEFYNLPNGDLLFLYRDGQSGNGDLVLNRYDVQTQRWEQVQDNLISGEGKRSAYWQLAVDHAGTIHLSWVWRESYLVETNHDMCYARSKDGGKTWEKSTGKKYTLPVTAASAEYAAIIPQKSELINTTSITADANGHPYMVTYWKPQNSDVPQYQLIYHDGSKWNTRQISHRKTPFSLSGGGTKRVPISRPLLILGNKGGRQKAIVIYRDEETGNKITALSCDDPGNNEWFMSNLTQTAIGQWEPSYDNELWKQQGEIDLFVQKVEQGDGETLRNVPPQPVNVLEWKP